MSIFSNFIFGKYTSGR